MHCIEKRVGDTAPYPWRTEDNQKSDHNDTFCGWGGLTEGRERRTLFDLVPEKTLQNPEGVGEDPKEV